MSEYSQLPNLMILVGEGHRPRAGSDSLATFELSGPGTQQVPRNGLLWGGTLTWLH